MTRLAFHCLLFLLSSLLAGCTGEEEGMPFGTTLSIRELQSGEEPESDWAVNVDEQGMNTLPSDLQELLRTAAVQGNASRHFTDEPTKPIFDWADEQWQAQNGEGKRIKLPMLIYLERTFNFYQLLH